MMLWLDFSDPFLLFRTLLFIVLTVYTVAVSVWLAAQLFAVLRGSDPSRRLLRTYLGYHFLTVRPGPLAGELVQLGLWTAALLLIWWLHTCL